jgi:hypothetical protein
MLPPGGTVDVVVANIVPAVIEREVLSQLRQPPAHPLGRLRVIAAAGAFMNHRARRGDAVRLLVRQQP